MKKETDILKVAMSILGKRSAAKLTREERVAKSKNAINARWEKYYNEKKQSKD